MHVRQLNNQIIQWSFVKPKKKKKPIRGGKDSYFWVPPTPKASAKPGRPEPQSAERKIAN